MLNCQIIIKLGFIRGFRKLLEQNTELIFELFVSFIQLKF